MTHSPDKERISGDPLAEAKRIMGNLARRPHKPHKPPSAPKPKTRSARKGRVHKAKSKF